MSTECEDCEGLLLLAKDWEDRLTKVEQLNAELARMLSELEWSGQGMDGDKECPYCNHLESSVEYRAHFPGCALSALLKKARTE